MMFLVGLVAWGIILALMARALSEPHQPRGGIMVIDTTGVPEDFEPPSGIFIVPPVKSHPTDEDVL